MKRNNVGLLATIVIILVILIFTIVVLNKPEIKTDEETAKCIGENSLMYVQLGCHACETQEKMFGEYVSYLNKIDCFYERDKCDGVEATPTWEIDGVKYRGVQSIETLKELTGC